MIALLDTSALVAMFVADSHTPRLTAWLKEARDRLAVSAWALTEFASAIRILERQGRVTLAARVAAEEALQDWMDGQGAVAVAPEDVNEARRLIQAASTPLRAPDALHLAIARRCGYGLATFDRHMSLAAHETGLPVELI